MDNNLTNIKPNLTKTIDNYKIDILFYDSAGPYVNYRLNSESVFVSINDSKWEKTTFKSQHKDKMFLENIKDFNEIIKFIVL